MQVSSRLPRSGLPVSAASGLAVFGHQERTAVTGDRKRLSRGAWASLAAVRPAPGGKAPPFCRLPLGHTEGNKCLVT